MRVRAVRALTGFRIIRVEPYRVPITVVQGRILLLSDKVRDIDSNAVVCQKVGSLLHYCTDHGRRPMGHQSLSRGY